MPFGFATPNRGVTFGEAPREYLGLSPGIIIGGIQDSPDKEQNVVPKSQGAAPKKKTNLKLSDTTDHVAENQQEWITFRKKKQRKRTPK